MDLQMLKAQHGSNWAWARTGALVLFVVTGLLLAVSLTITHSRANDAALPSVTNISTLFHPAAAG